MREIVFDTETTGFDPNNGDRVVEIGCVELLNGMPTGKSFHKYLNPKRDMPESAFKIHGLSSEFLSDKPLFGEVVEEFLTFVGPDNLVAHNAEFDMKFLNWEMENAGLQKIPLTRMVDTLKIARSKFPGAKNSLDALCSRYSVDNTDRNLHGALLDAKLLANDDVIAVHVTFGDEDEQAFMTKWKKHFPDVRLVILHSEYRSIIRPISRFIDKIRKKANDKN